MECVDVSGLVGGSVIRRTVKLSTWLIIAFVVLNVLIGVVSNVSTSVSDSDEAVFHSILGLKKPQGALSYEQEIELIKSAQALVLKKAPVGEPIDEYSDRESENLFQKKVGCVMTAQELMTRIFSWYGFGSRHLYILYPEHPVTGEKLSFLRAFFTKGTNSHAVTEIKTSRGWLVVDSNSLWMSVVADGSPVDADHIYMQANRFASIPVYWNRPYWAVRGLYSRRGQLYRPYIPYPELNWYDFLSWVVLG